MRKKKFDESKDMTRFLVFDTETYHELEARAIATNAGSVDEYVTKLIEREIQRKP